MAHTTPRLDEPAPGWTHDLPGPNQPPSRTPFPSVLSNPPNHVDDVYLELACSTTRIRGIGLWGAVFIFASAIYLAFFMIMLAANSPIHLPLEIGTAGLITVVISIWLGIYLYRIDVQAPRDEPIRFNRLRRKVYVYKFQHDGLRPFSRTAWGVRPAIYDWDDLHAEACRLYVPGTALIENITLTVLEPGTTKVLHRFPFAYGIQQGEMYWAMAQLFMQQGPDALPTFPYVPRDWNNEDVSFNLARRLAPKVVWPAEMDLESRTAP